MPLVRVGLYVGICRPSLQGHQLGPRFEPLTFTFENKDDISELLQSLAPEDKPFFERLLHTQMFAVYSDTFLATLLRGVRGQSEEKLLQRLDELLAKEEKAKLGAENLLRLYQERQDAAEEKKVKESLRRIARKITALRLSKEHLQTTTQQSIGIASIDGMHHLHPEKAE